MRNGLKYPSVKWLGGGLSLVKYKLAYLYWGHFNFFPATLKPKCLGTIILKSRWPPCRTCQDHLISPATWRGWGGGERSSVTVLGSDQQRPPPFLLLGVEWSRVKGQEGDELEVSSADCSLDSSWGEWESQVDTLRSVRVV